LKPQSTAPTCGTTYSASKQPNTVPQPIKLEKLPKKKGKNCKVKSPPLRKRRGIHAQKKKKRRNLNGKKEKV
jgi:hypothetical protein